MKIAKSIKFKGCDGEDLVAFITAAKKPEIYFCEDWDYDVKDYIKRDDEDRKEWDKSDGKYASNYSEEELRLTSQVATLDHILDHDYFLRMPLSALATN